MQDSRAAVPSRKTEPSPGRVVDSDLDGIVDDSEDDFPSEIRGRNADRVQALPPPPASRLHQGTSARRIPRATAVVSAVPGSIFACSDARRATDVGDDKACQVFRVHADGSDRSAYREPSGVLGGIVVEQSEAGQDRLVSDRTIATHAGHKRFRSAGVSQECRASDDVTSALPREEEEYAGEGDRGMETAGQESPVYTGSRAFSPGNGSGLVHAVGVPQRRRKPQRDWGGSPSENLCSATFDDSVSAPSVAASAAVKGASETLQIVSENALVEPPPELARATDLLPASRSPMRSTDAADPSAASSASAAVPVAVATVPLAATLPVVVICGGAATLHDVPVPPVASVQACSVQALSEREWMQSIKERYKIRTQTLIDAVEACRIVDGSVARTAVRAKIERLLHVGFGGRFGLVELTAALARLREQSIGASDLWDVVISELAAAQGA